MTNDVAAIENSGLNHSYGELIGGTRDTRRNHGCGGTLASCAFHAEFINTDGTPMDHSSVIPDPAVAFPCGEPDGLVSSTIYSDSALEYISSGVQGGLVGSEPSHQLQKIVPYCV